ncbi:hypothetical protein SDC9_144472 [bioreactor metagenome]|uniref:Uncharacterized protein n=1 Tax=bioreactor metagenome TaxID=1076179 RepID=A0A645E6Z1_9ZZZZ
MINRSCTEYDNFFSNIVKNQDIEFEAINEFDYEDINYIYYSDNEENHGKIYCAEDGKYHDIEDAWMYDGSC